MLQFPVTVYTCKRFYAYIYYHCQLLTISEVLVDVKTFWYKLLFGTPGVGGRYRSVIPQDKVLQTKKDRGQASMDKAKENYHVGNVK